MGPDGIDWLIGVVSNDPKGHGAMWFGASYLVVLIVWWVLGFKMTKPKKGERDGKDDKEGF